jgi:UDP-2,3-diacylglucosamine pyrophosphatase LpxH
LRQQESHQLDETGPKYTAVISDLHLCEAEPEHPKYKLWKKYKSRQFFFDHTFSNFLAHLTKLSNGQPVELILNGDIFDFDSCTALPDEPIFRISWLERHRGLHPQEEKSTFKIEKILDDHREWVQALSRFIKDGNSVVFIVGNHDIELQFPNVQKSLLKNLDLTPEEEKRVRINEWFYISQNDTLIEHGNQYDPYCVCEDPLHPFVKEFNRVEVRVPFGNLATRFMINGMGFFNPHVDSNYIMSIKEYVFFFAKYMVRAQPLLLVTWFWGAVFTLVRSLLDRLKEPIRNPLTVEDKVENAAAKANATPRMVRELKELFVAPAASDPLILLKELWLDRAFLVLAAFYIVFQIFLFIKQVYSISFFWMFIPLFLLLPFFIFYSKTITSDVIKFKEPRENILSTAALITNVRRIVYGHTHIVRHEMIGPVEHLNAGCWSPAFLDVECQKPIDQKTFVWIQPSQALKARVATLYKFQKNQIQEVFRRSSAEKTHEEAKNE